MKRRPCCVGGMSARREQQCSDWENVWGPIGASAFPTCARWQPSQRGRGRASRLLATCAKPSSWLQTSSYQANSGRSRRRWQGCMRQRAYLSKRTQRLGRRRRSSRNWRRASGMRRCVRAFWRGHRFNQWCNKLVATSTRSRKTMHSQYSIVSLLATPSVPLSGKAFHPLPLQGILNKKKKYLSKKILSNKLSTLHQVSGTMSANNPEDEHQPIFHGGYILWTDFNAASRLRVASSLLTSCCVMPGL